MTLNPRPLLTALFLLSLACGGAVVRPSHPPTYDDALRTWRRLEEINAWIAERFAYDRARALELSETRRQGAEARAVREPADFYRDARGVCVDLSRFAYETTRRIEPGARPRYLMIEFEPFQVDGETFRRHWLVIFTRAGQFYSFADSRRPGHIAGPFGSIEDLVADYQRFRGRKIVSARVLDDFRKRKLRKRRARRAAG